MFDEGSPKASHGVAITAGVIAAVGMFIASFGAEITYRAGGREITLTEGPALAQFLAILIPPLLIAWHRGYLDGQWPLIASAICSAFALLFLAGDWLTASRAEATELAVTAQFYLAMAAAAATALVAAIALRIPVVERSESAGHWQSRTGGRR